MTIKIQQFQLSKTK